MLQGRNNTASEDIHMGYSTPRKVPHWILSAVWLHRHSTARQVIPEVTLSWHTEVTELVGMSGCPQGLHFHFA